MALGTRNSKKRIDVVFHADPMVEPNDPHAWGWMLKSMAAVSDGADVIQVRSLNIEERAEAMDAGRFHSRHLVRCRFGISKVNGRKDSASREAWLECVDDDNIITLLGVVIQKVTEGRAFTDLREWQVGWTNPDADDDEESDEDEESD